MEFKVEWSGVECGVDWSVKWIGVKWSVEWSVEWSMEWNGVEWSVEYEVCNNLWRQKKRKRTYQTPYFVGLSKL